MLDLEGKPKIKDVPKFLADARGEYQADLDADRIDRDEAESDNCFANATDSNQAQWEALTLESRKKNHRPVLQWNRIPTYVQQVVNDGRQNKPAIKIAPADNGTKETAEFFQSRIRQIEYECDADVAYDSARDQQVTSGRGFIRIYADYVPGTFKQRLCIERISNQFAVVFDRGARAYDLSDATHCFVTELITRDEFKRRYPEGEFQDVDFNTRAKDFPQWFGLGEKGDMIQIAEYWVKEFKNRTLCKLTDGSAAWKDELDDEQFQTLVALNDEAKPIEREEQDATVCRYIINGAEVLEEGEWIGSSIPIVPMWGREATVQGVKRTFSLIRQAKDPQRGLNLLVSNLMEALAAIPKAPWEAPVGSIAANHEQAWRDAGHVPKAILYYLQYDQKGQQLNRPERVTAEPPIQATVIGIQSHIDGIKAAMGIYDASLGNRSNETSGVAIERRKKSAEIVNFHFSDNEARTRKRIGEILVELIPILDKPGTSVPIRSEDGKTEIVPIGEVYTHPKTGKAVIHNLTDGDYGVVVSTGPSYSSAREQEHEKLLEWVQAKPELMGVIGDLVFRTSDFPGSQDIADRMERYITASNPGLIQNGEEPPISPEVQAKIIELTQQLQATQAFAQSLHEKLETKEPDLQNRLDLKTMELDFQRQKLETDSNVKVELEKLKQGYGADMELLRQDIARIQRSQEMAHAEQMARDAREHEAEQAEAQRAAELEAQSREMAVGP